MEKPFYTAREAQAKLGLSKAMFFRKVNDGLIPRVVPTGMKQGVYPKRDIDALASSMNSLFTPNETVIFSRSSPADQLEEMNMSIHCFGRDFVTPLNERIAFQQKNDLTFHSLKVAGQVVGYISMFRLPEAFLDDLLTGRKIQRDITLKEMRPLARLEPFPIYLDGVATDPHLPPALHQPYTDMLLFHFISLLLNLLLNGYQLTCIYTVVTLPERETLVQQLNFQQMVGKSIAPGRTAYEYILDEPGIARMREYVQNRQ